MNILYVTKSKVYFIRTNTLPACGDYVCYKSHFLNEEDVVLEVLAVVHNPSVGVLNKIRVKVKDAAWFDSKIAHGVTALIQAKEINDNC